MSIKRYFLSMFTKADRKPIINVSDMERSIETLSSSSNSVTVNHQEDLDQAQSKEVVSFAEMPPSMGTPSLPKTSPKTTITSLAPEILINIFENLNGKGIHDIDPTIFAAVEVHDTWKYIIYQVIFSLNFDAGITLGFEHYLDDRFERLREMHRPMSQNCRRIQAEEARAVQMIKDRVADKKKKQAVIETTLRNKLTYAQQFLGPYTLSGPFPSIATPIDRGANELDNVIRSNRVAMGKLIAQSESERASFTKETQDIFDFQSSWGARRRLIRGVENNEWVWAEIVAARIESDQREQKDKTKEQWQGVEQWSD